MIIDDHCEQGKLQSSELDVGGSIPRYLQMGVPGQSTLLAENSFLREVVARLPVRSLHSYFGVFRGQVRGPNDVRSGPTRWCCWILLF